MIIIVPIIPNIYWLKPIDVGDKRLHIFPKGISPKVNSVA